MTVRATARGAQRTPLHGERADVVICGASFAGLAVARELAGSRADVLLLDRYEIGERPTSACAIPTPWVRAMGVEASVRQDIAHMRFTTPHGSYRYRLPWSWSAVDYRALCELLHAQNDARFATATVAGVTATADGHVVRTDRGDVHAGLVVDACGWRRVLATSGYQPPDAPLSRGLEVHPDVTAGDLRDLHVWVQRDVVRYGYGWSVPADGEARVGVGSYEPRHHVKRPTAALAAREGHEPVRYQGNWFPHRLRDATEGGVFFVGDSAGHCIPLSGEGIRTAFHFGIACGRELRAVLGGGRSRDQALARYAAFSAGHRRFFAIALAMQRLVPALPPRVLTAALRVIGHQRIVDRAFGWYLAVAAPEPVAAEAITTRSREGRTPVAPRPS